MSPTFCASVRRIAARVRGTNTTSLRRLGWILTIILLAGAEGARAQNQVIALEGFESDPLARGWRISGEPALFAWNAVQQSVDVTWDSSKSNSFFHLPIGTILTKADDFRLTFVLRMKDIRIGSTPGKPSEFPIAVGLINRQTTTNQSGYRGAGVSSVYGIKNIAEWNFFPDAGFGDTWATTVISTNNVFAYAHTFPLALDTGGTYRITLEYTAAGQTLRTAGFRNGQSVGVLEDVSLAGTPDFRLDAISITSYSDAVQVGPPIYHGSVLAHGTIEEIGWSIPSPPVDGLTLRTSPAGASVEFSTKTNWLYVLQRSINLLEWRTASVPVAGGAAKVVLQDTNAPAPNAFYRVRAERE
jgi:hypothetical protein